MKRFNLSVGLLFVFLFSFAMQDTTKMVSLSKSSKELNVVKPIIIGYIDKEEIFSKMPQIEVIEKELHQLENEYEEEFVNMTKEYERKVKSYLEHNKQMSEPIKLAKQTEITELESRMSMYKKRYKEEIAKRREEKCRPIKEQINLVIKEVCVEENVTILFDEAQPIYMSSQCVDLTTKVKAKFGL